MKTQKKYLASANTGAGFKNYFDNINKQQNSFCFILKGGPGTGKSSVIKKIASHFESMGFDIEYFYCSSDEESLDAIKIKNISIVDGTAPHTTEATMPGIKEKIVNIGDFIKSDIKKHKTKIENLIAKKSNCFALAYKYFFILKTLVEIELLDQKKLKNNLNLSCLKNNNFYNDCRTLFASYISPAGFKSFYKNNNYKKVIELKDSFINNQTKFKILEEKLKKQKCYYTKFLNVFDCNLTEAILENKTQTLFVSSDIYNSIPIFKNKTIANFTIKKVAKYLSKAKFYHKKIESFYIPNVDFDKLNNLTQSLIAEISNLIL